MSAATRTAPAFTSVTTVGGLLPSDMLLRIAEAAKLPGTKPADYHLPASVAVRDEAERAWEYLKPLWRDLRTALPSDPKTGAPAADPTGRAGNDWLAQLFRKLDFGRLTEVGAPGVPAGTDPAKHFPVSHRHGAALVHQIPWNQELDKRASAGQVPAQSMLQDCLNRTDAHLWAVLTNGRRVRLLRDSSALATAAYVEFDLEAIFDGELFSEFVLLYMTLHASRFEVGEGQPASGCWLEKWRAEAVTSGARALDQLRLGVQHALTVLGTGFLRHPANTALREDVKPKELQAALLRLVYRLLFIFVAEDREALLRPDATDRQRETYEKYFSSARLRTHARRRQGTAHSDLYEALRIVLDALGAESGRPELGLPGLGGLFSHKDADTPLDGLKLSNESLLTAVRHLAQVRDPGARRWRSVDYRHLDAEELGSVYESLLELEPKHSAADRSFELVEVAGNSRKTTGSYYTPSSLIECLLDTTLNPVIDDAVQRGEERAASAGRPDPADDIVDELLSLTVCDPACGSGHFLVASARRIAKRVASVRERNPEPTADAVRHALHEVIARCIYGVDLNPMAVELAKVSLWLEALEPGKPLGFLDAHVKHGNGLIGATPSLLAGGVPDEAFDAIEGDDKKYANALKKRNKAQRGGQSDLFTDAAVTVPANTRLAAELTRITNAPADELSQVNAQQAAYEKYVSSSAYTRERETADTWCAAFVWPKREGAPEAPTYDVVRGLLAGNGSTVSDETLAEVLTLSEQYHFFHWHLEFPEVFAVPESGAEVDPVTGWAGGFDAVLGNPPWDSVNLPEVEFFAVRAPEIAATNNTAARKKKIEALRNNPDTVDLYDEHEAAKRKTLGASHFLRNSGRYPLTGQGNLNLYALFAEDDRILTAARGRTGVIIPTGIATDARTQYFFKDLVSAGSLAALFDFENRASLFPAVDSRMKFCVLSLAGRSRREPAARFAFFLHDPAELESADKAFTLTPEEITLLNPNTGTCPVFRSRRDAEITLGIYRRVPVLLNESDKAHGNPWAVSFMQGLFNMSHDSHLFRPSAANGETLKSMLADGWHLDGNVLVRGGERLLPLYEAKMLHHYDHRWATYTDKGEPRDLTLAEKRDPTAVALPRYWASEQNIPTGTMDKRGAEVKVDGVRQRLENRGWAHDWLLGWRDICRATDERTVIAALAPANGFNHKFLIALADDAELLGAALSSLAFDYAARQAIGGTSMSFFIMKQLPAPTAALLAPHSDFIRIRLLELTYTANDMTPFAHDLGDTGTPFRWDEDRRATIRAELDALFFHLYGITRDDASYILDTFPIVRRKDEAAHGEYRTKRLILDEYDRMAAAGLTLENPLTEGEDGTYRSTLTPPPGHGPRHPADTRS
ncbi:MULTISPECIES: Eco57I restriction-modification methylase domain-containing protein [unclassified Streptomyces]|uniref:Eco57I restriction-modification methylase domain-containing protein n=1 Tax=unclassified Streptomyces TaxID=2593676 RepID=UPI000DAE64E0|nr:MULTISPECIES: DNA methyltransferase [unclassified Streptomyces]PZT77519.1 SAM-dependent DNA methyltransferase [Streptomyces sp. AC1-42W]PZT78526.1 SAM-dependent DNA methyltransferase [Streptomyces sp. AC1-42T]